MCLINKLKVKAINYVFYRINKKKYADFPFLTQEKRDFIRLEKLKAILQSALLTVPYYKRMNLDIDFESFTFEELKKFPIITKKIIKNNFNDFKSSEHAGVISHTSGSSGNPFEFLVGNNSSVIENLTKCRAWGMGDSYIKGDPIIILRSYSPQKGEPIHFVDRKNNYWFLSPFDINAENLEMYISFIEKSKAKLIRGYPSSLYIFTLLLKNEMKTLPQIKSLITSSEMLLPLYKDVVESFWGISILDWYGQNEQTVTVQKCAAGNYHNNDDYGFIELTEDNEIIGTSLNNFAMPFIRYNTGDKAIPNICKQECCPCGRTLSVPFIGIEGRSDDVLFKKNGTLIPSINFYTLMHQFFFIVQWQLQQEVSRDITVNIVATSELTPEQIISIKDGVMSRLGDVTVNVNELRAIKRSVKTGKIKVIIQKGRKNVC